MDNFETMVQNLVAGENLRTAVATYALVTEPTDDMLSWEPTPAIQPLPFAGLWRVGILGDGNCLIHTMLFAASPTYRAHTKAARKTIAIAVRATIAERLDDLRDLADAFYPEIGSAGLEEAFAVIPEDREEIGVEVAPLIARLYGCNFLAVQVREGLTLRPVRATMINYDPELPTILCNYIGGGVNFGHANFQEDGHYEVLIQAVQAAPAAASSSEKAAPKRKTRKAKKPKVPPFVLDDTVTRYIFNTGDAALEAVLALFAHRSSSAKKASSGTKKASNGVKKASSGTRKASNGAPKAAKSNGSQ